MSCECRHSDALMCSLLAQEILYPDTAACECWCHITDKELEKFLLSKGRIFDALYPPFNKSFRQNLDDLKQEMQKLTYHKPL